MKSSPVNKDKDNVINWVGKENQEKENNYNFSPNNKNNFVNYPKKESNNNSKEKFSNLINNNKEIQQPPQEEHTVN